MNKSINSLRSIEYLFFDTPFGPSLIAGSKQGICFLSFVDETSQISLAHIQSLWPEHKLVPGSAALKAMAKSVFARPDTHAPSPTLDFHGTTFQCEVWAHLATIPFGQTCTYGQIAKDIGRPKSARAVAGAVASNQLAYLVPCHRVVPGSGRGAGGYRWGSLRKAAILGWEQANSLKLTDLQVVQNTRI